MFNFRAQNKNYISFIVLARTRTGSNLLLNSLKTHPHIKVFGEIFRGGANDAVKKSVIKSAEKYLKKNIFTRYDKSIEAVGFKIFYQHPVWDPSGRVWTYLQSLDDLKVIHLKRKNILRTLVSQEIAKKTDVWKEVERKIEPKDKKINLSIEECAEFFKKTRHWEDEGDKKFSSNSLLQLNYEELANDYQSQMQRVLTFLDVSPIELQPKTRKQNPEPLRDLIEDYDKLKKAFFESSWQVFFE